MVLVEGAPLIAEAIAAGWEVEEEFIAPSGSAVSEQEPTVLSDAALQRVATTESPRPNVAVVRRRSWPALGSFDCVLVLDRLADPGNLGTLIRSAEAAGIDAVVVTPGTVDAFAPKSVRSSAGAVFHVPVIEAGIDEVCANGFSLIATSSHRGDDHRSADWSGRVALVLGNEAHGVDLNATRWVRIEHRGRAESLNVAMAGTLLLFSMSDARSSAN